MQDQKQKGEAEQRAAVSQLGLELQQARQQLVAVRKEASDSKLEIDSLKRYAFARLLCLCISVLLVHVNFAFGSSRCCLFWYISYRLTGNLQV